MKKSYLFLLLLAVLGFCVPNAMAEDLTLSFRHNRATNILGGTTTKLTFTAKTNVEANIAIYVGTEQIASAESALQLKETYEFPGPGDYVIKAVATDGTQTLEQSIMVAYVEDSAPAASQNVPNMGITKNADGTMTFCFAAPQKTSVMLIGSWNDYAATNTQVMQYIDKTVDGNELRYFVYTLPKEKVQSEFLYYYLIDGKMGVADPYAMMVLDPSNDKYISSEVFPNMPEYPEGKVTGNGCLAWYGDNLLAYDWKTTNFRAPDTKNLVIYEMLFRDFTGTEGAAKGNGTVRAAIEKIPYLKELGVNVIELLPINEFNGNNSWGYNPNFYFAADKAYGTPQDYKEFIDICHANGMAVVLDVVFNQCDWQHPWYKMYTAGSNPFINATAPHAYNVLNDWNQGYPLVEQQEKDMLKFWLSEYNVDGFRFDLVKGLGNNDSYPNSGDSGTNAYNKSRIERMKRLHDAMREVNPNAYFINENLAGSDEENAMAKDGELNWANVNDAGCQFAMGYSSNASLLRMNAAKDNRTPYSTVAYLESHDEQRLAYKQNMWGVDGIKGDREKSMQRLSSAAAQMILVPGAHMIWMFSEMGNAQNTKDDTGGNNTSPKIVNWNLLDNEYNKGLMESYSELIHLRTANPELFNDNDTYKNSTGGWSKGRTILSTTEDKEFYCVINPNVDKDIEVTVNFRSDNQNDYYIASKTYNTTPIFDAAAKKVVIEPNCYAVFTTNNVTAVEDIVAEAGDYSVIRGTEGGIILSGVSGMVNVYALNGALVASQNASGMSTIAVAPGLYIVKADGKTAKVIVK